MPAVRLLASLLLASLLLAFLAGIAGCSRPEPPPRAPGATGADLPDPAWVKVYDPQRAWNGYTLTLHRGRVPVILDMNGAVVHSWPSARVKSRVRLLPDGSLLGIGLGRRVVELDWEGREAWSFETAGAFPHHDLIRLAGGNTLVLLQHSGERADTLVEVDRQGRVVWSWRALDHLAGRLPPRPSDPNDLTHVNSLQELPENPLFAAGDDRFRPGNLLLSARNLDAAFILDKATGEVVWWFSQGLDRQHEALMNGPGLPRPGRIQVFNNRRRSFRGDRQSEVLELDPASSSVRWRYKAPGFYSPTGGVQQALPNGNVLITSTGGGRVFEVTREGETVWEWAPPYPPGRAIRLAPDACPQLPGLRARRTRPVVPPPGYRHVDPESYRFARRGSRTAARVDGVKRTVLKGERDCRRLLLPADPALELAYGVDPQRLAVAGAPPPTFVVRLLPDGGEARELLRDTVGPEGPGWRRATVSLAAHGLERVELCLDIEGGSGPAAPRHQRFAYWEQPTIAPAGAAPAGDEEAARAAAPGDLTPEELEVRRQHLEALGYVD